LSKLKELLDLFLLTHLSLLLLLLELLLFNSFTFKLFQKVFLAMEPLCVLKMEQAGPSFAAGVWFKSMSVKAAKLV
jgi:hypothetical protein